MAVSTQAFVSPSTLVRVGFFALVYYLGVRVGLELVISPGEITALWPANPIAIALVILSPPRIWPAYFVVLFPSTLLATLPGGEFPVRMVLGLTASDAVEIFLAAWLMRRFVGTPLTFTRVKDVLGLVAFGAGLSCAVSGLFGAAVFAASLPDVSYWPAWRAWTIAGGTGIIFITPVLLVGTTAGGISLNTMRILRVVEAGALCAVIMAASILVFGHGLTSGKLPQLLESIPPQALSYLMFPWLIWAALRFGPRGAAAASFTVGLVATWSTYHGYGPFVVHDGPVATDIFSLQLFLATVVLTSLLLAAIIAERKRAEEVLRESEERLGAWMDNTRTPITVKDTEGRYLLANKQFQERFKIRGEEIVGKTAHDLFPPEYADSVSAQDRQVLETGTAGERENETPLPDGTTRTTILHKFPIIRPDGVCMGIGTIETDITERKWAEKAVRASEERLQRSVLDAPIPIMIHAEDGEVLMISQKWTELTGYTHAEIPTIDVWTEKAYGPIKDESRERIGTLYGIDRKKNEGGYILTTARGEQRIWDFRSSPLGRLPDGRRFVISMAMDITERKRVEAALLRAKRQNEMLLEAAGEGIYGLDFQGRTTFMNPAAARMIGWEPEDLVGRHPHDILHHTKPDGSPYLREECPIYAAFKDGQRHHVADEVFWRKDGTSFPVEYTSTPIRVEGELAGAVVVFRDITKRKRSHEKLRKSEELLRGAVDSLQEGFALYDADDRLVLFNDEYRRLHPDTENMIKPGMRYADMLRANVENGANADAIGREEEFIRDRLERHRNPKGPIERRLTSGVTYIIKESRTRDGGIAVTLTDITENKRAELLQKGRAKVLERLAAGAPLEEVLALLVAATEEVEPGMLCSVLLLDKEGKRLRHGAAPRLPDFYNQAIDGLEIGPGVGSCGNAAHTGQRMIVEDVMTHPYWLKFRKLAKKAKLRACWSQPILSAAGEVLGTFAIYYREPRPPDESDLDLIMTAAHLAGIAIERRRAEEALRASEQRFKDVAEATSDWFWEMDENLRFTFFSGRRQEVTGLSPEENIGKTRWEVAGANPDDDEKWRHHRATLQAHEPFRDFEFAVTTKDGRTLHNKVSGRPVLDANGVFKGYRGAATDVTEQIEAQAQLIQASKLATLGEMASGIAHELNQPLSVVGMASELSLMSMDAGAFDTEFVRKKLETIAGQRERMAGIINHMRLFSRKDNSRLAPFDPAESVRGAVGLTAKQLEASGVELETTVPAACRNVSGHALQLEQVVLNLLNNARDAVVDAMESAGSGNGRPVPRVRVSLVDDKRRKAVVISVADTGGGVPEQALGRIFDPFFTTKKEGRGTGLGLSISYSIIDAMGGRLEAQNADDGAVFRITLPVCADRPGAAERRPKARNRKPPTCKPRSHLPRVLFVEDEEAIVKEVAEYLRRKGYEVVTAGNAVEALELQASRPADMVITDLLMPGMGGNELIRRLRQADPELPIVLMTGHTDFGDEQDTVAEGASAVLQKPISLRELSERLQRMVNR